MTRDSALAQPIGCKGPRGQRITLDGCLMAFLEANALEDRRASCWRCPHGRAVREAYADDKPIPPPPGGTARYRTASPVALGLALPLAGKARAKEAA